jgi:hypothetical protein
MNPERQRRNVFVRHPIIFGVAILVIAAVLFTPKTPERKKLDYSKPIYTVQSAIICPQSLFFDPRADHDPNAIFDVFISILHRDEKARALGCEVVREGIPVTAHRMESPFNDYVAVSLSGQQNSSLFTMEANLENDEADSPSSASSSAPASASPATVSENAQQTKVEGYEEERTMFQKQLASLEKPASNLRWFSGGDPLQGSSPGRVYTFLFTPYGMCASMIGDATQGYSVMSLHLNPYMTNEPDTSLGSFSNKPAAAAAAVQYCHQWYTTEASKAHSSTVFSHLYFSPDSEDEPTPSPEVVAPPIEDLTQPSVREEPNGATPAHAEGGQALQYGEQPSSIAKPETSFRWQLRPNGDEVLTGPSGPCATLALQSAHDPNKVHVNFNDGSAKVYPVEETPAAMQAATEYCRAHQ